METVYLPREICCDKRPHQSCMPPCKKRAQILQGDLSQYRRIGDVTPHACVRNWVSLAFLLIVLSAACTLLAGKGVPHCFVAPGAEGAFVKRTGDICILTGTQTHQLYRIVSGDTLTRCSAYHT